MGGKPQRRLSVRGKDSTEVVSMGERLNGGCQYGGKPQRRLSVPQLTAPVHHQALSYDLTVVMGTDRLNILMNWSIIKC